MSRHIDVFSPPVKALSFDFICAFYIYFYAGTIFRNEWQKIKPWLGKSWFASLLFIAGISPLVISLPWYVVNACRLALVIDLFLIFRSYAFFFDSSSVVSRGLQLIGRNTLEIYFIHYFFHFNMNPVLQWLMQFNSDWSIRSHFSTGILEVIVVGSIAVVISLACILVKKMLKPFPFISRMCFGTR